MAGGVQWSTTLLVEAGGRQAIITFMVADRLNTMVMLGYPWLREFEPPIHWGKARLDASCYPIIISEILLLPYGPPPPWVQGPLSQVLGPLSVRTPSPRSTPTTPRPPGLPSPPR